MTAVQHVTQNSENDDRNVGVRELRQYLSVYLERVKRGETLRVTERGRVVAVLAPLPAERLSALERLAAERRATTPARSLATLPAPTAGAGGLSSEQVLADLREERI